MSCVKFSCEHYYYVWNFRGDCFVRICLIQSILSHYYLVRLWDPTTQLLLLRVPRDDCGKIRASLTVWTHYDEQSETTNNNSRNKRSRIAASVLSVNGSARTAKRSALLHVRKWYRGRFLQEERNDEQQKQQRTSRRSAASPIPIPNRKGFDKDCRKLQDLITTIQAID
jgi:hypothetical protein